jgi:acetamidase/formamidase
MAAPSAPARPLVEKGWSAEPLAAVGPRLIRQPGAYAHAFAPGCEPIATVRPGEVVAIETADCFGGRLTREDQAPSEVLGDAPLNPLTGPIWVEGAEPGDTLIVRIEAIHAVGDRAVSCLLPFCGGLTATHEAPALAPQLPEQVWFYERTPGGFAWRDRWEIPWAPFFGTIGTAPARGAVPSDTPGPHGGNMDIPEATVGRALHLPVQVPGALFFVGDAHAAQGQGELGGPALEIAAVGTFRFGLIKGRPIAWPRIESETAIMTIGSARPMEDAARIAYHELVGWLAAEHGFEPLEAYQLLTQVGGLSVAQMVNPAYTLVASCPRRYLPAGGGVGRVAAEPDAAGVAVSCPAARVSCGHPRRLPPG